MDHRTEKVAGNSCGAVASADEARPSISYEVSGSSGSLALVLLHSLATDSSVWDLCLSEWTDQFRIVRMDSRGHGRSAAGPVASVEAWVSDIGWVLDDARISQAWLVGVSMGGIQALAFAARHPERVAGLVVADSFARLAPEIAEQRIDTLVRRAQSQPMTEVAEQYIQDTFHNIKGTGADIVRTSMSAMDQESYIAAVVACFRADVEHELSSVSAPTLVLWGDLDSKTPQHLSEAIASGLRNAELQVLSAAGHLSNLDNPQGFAQSVTSFITATTLCAQDRPQTAPRSSAIVPKD
jgi:3-oxoadipate enol-lactonase